MESIDHKKAQQRFLDGHKQLAVCPQYRMPGLIEEANKFHRIPGVPKLKMPQLSGDSGQLASMKETEK